MTYENGQTDTYITESAPKDERHYYLIPKYLVKPQNGIDIRKRDRPKRFKMILT
jgi:hypothetical protein